MLSDATVSGELAANAGVSTASLAIGAEASPADAAAAIAWWGEDEAKGSLKADTAWAAAEGCASAAAALCAANCGAEGSFSACLRSESTSSQALVESTSNSSDPTSSKPAAFVPLSA